MGGEIKRNCSSCKFSWLNRCETLKKELNKNGFDDSDGFKKNWEIEFKVKDNLVCDKYNSMYIEYPLEVSKINRENNKGSYRGSQVGKLAMIRPCGEEYEGKTYLGLYLGELPIEHHVSHNPDTKELNISFLNNPAIFVFDLNKIVYGMESWWRIIDNELDFKEITDFDINNIWYVKALKKINESKVQK